MEVGGVPQLLRPVFTKYLADFDSFVDDISDVRIVEH